MNWAIPQPLEPYQKELNSSNPAGEKLWLAITVSLSLHLVAIIVFYLLAKSPEQLPVIIPGTVTINFFPGPAPLSFSEDELLPEPLVESAVMPVAANPTEPARVDELTNESMSIAEAAPISSSGVEVPSVVAPATTERPVQGLQQEPLISPTVMAIRQTIQSVFEKDDVDDWKFNCDSLQLKNPLLECQDQSQYDFSQSDNTAVVRSFIPGLPLDTGRQTQALLGQNASEINDRVSSILSVPGIDSEYIKEEIEAGIGVYSSNANAPLQRIQNQIYANDPAYQQMMRVLGQRPQ